MMAAIDTIVTNPVMVMLKMRLIKILRKPTGKTLKLTIEYKSKANAPTMHNTCYHGLWKCCIDTVSIDKTNEEDLR